MHNPIAEEEKQRQKSEARLRAREEGGLDTEGRTSMGRKEAGGGSCREVAANCPVTAADETKRRGKGWMDPVLL